MGNSKRQRAKRAAVKAADSPKLQNHNGRNDVDVCAVGSCNDVPTRAGAAVEQPATQRMKSVKADLSQVVRLDAPMTLGELEALVTQRSYVRGHATRDPHLLALEQLMQTHGHSQIPKLWCDPIVYPLLQELLKTRANKIVKSREQRAKRHLLRKGCET